MPDTIENRELDQLLGFRENLAADEFILDVMRNVQHERRRRKVILLVFGLIGAAFGLLGAVLLGVGRGFGETMAVLMATGHSINIPTSVFDSVRALTATIAAELGETAAGSPHYQALFTIGIFLFIVTFIINLVADLVVRGVRKG